MRLVIRPLLFLLGGILLARCLAYMSYSIAPGHAAIGYVERQEQIAALMEQRDQIEALAVGNSHNLAIDFATLEQQGYHLWHNGGDIFEATYLLEVLLPDLPNVGTVYVSTPYSVFWIDNRSSDIAIRRRQLYATLASWSFLENDLQNFILGKLHPLLLTDYWIVPDHWSRVRSALWDGGGNKLVPVDRAKNGQNLADGYVECESTPRETLDDHAAQRAADHLERQEAVIAIDPAIEHRAKQAMTGMIDFLKGRGIRTVFFTPLYEEGYTSRYDAGTIAKMRSRMVQLTRAYGVEYYDFSANAELLADDHLFLNSDHLNLCGAQRFSAKLKAAMAQHTGSLAPRSAE